MVSYLGPVRTHLSPAPRLRTRETNLKFRQAPPVTHHELTSVRKMASFQGEGQQAGGRRTRLPPAGLHLPLCVVGAQVPHLAGVWRWQRSVSGVLGVRIAFKRGTCPEAVSRPLHRHNFGDLLCC